jgi:hypothetical protein
MDEFDRRILVEIYKNTDRIVTLKAWSVGLQVVMCVILFGILFIGFF